MSTLNGLGPTNVLLVRAGEDGFFGGRLAAMDALAGAAWLLERDAAHGGFGFFLDVRLAFGVAAPPGEGESFFDGFFEFFVIGGLVGIRFAEGEGAVEERRLDFFERLHHGCGDSLLRVEDLSLFSRPVAAGQDY